MFYYFFFFFGGFVGPIRKRIFIFEESSKSVEQFSENALEISIEKTNRAELLE